MYDKEVIILYDAKIASVPHSRAELLSYDKPYIYYTDEHGEDSIESTIELQRELIQSIPYKHPMTGEVIYLGCSKQIQDLIGMQYESLQNLLRNSESLNRMLGEARGELYKTRKELTMVKNKTTLASFWTRLKWLFKGVSW